MRQKIIEILFWIFIVIYVSILLIKPEFAVTDDHVFLSTIQVGKPLFFISTKNGRFEPLNTQEYYLLSHIFSPTPALYWTLNAVQLIIFNLINFNILKRISDNKIFIYITLFFLLVLPGFASAWSRFLVGEKGAVFCLAVFIYCYLIFIEKPSKKGSIVIGLVGLIFANFALYYKETIFIALGVFSCVHLIFSWKQLNWKVKFLDVLLLISSFTFALVYFFNIYSKITTSYTESHAVFSQNLNSFAAYSHSDPFLIFCVLPFSVWRAFAVLIKKQSVYPVYDALLVAAVIYIAVFFKLHIHAPYYLIPAYIFAIPALFFFVSQSQQLLISWKRWCVFFVVGFLITTSVPEGINDLILWKYDTVNYNQAVDFLVHDISSSRNTQGRVSIFLPDINRGTGLERYISVGRFLQYKGLATKDFDLKSNLPVDDDSLFSAVAKDAASPYSVFQSDDIAQISKGDYLVVGFFNYHNYQDVSKIRNRYLNNDYELAFRTQSKFFIDIPTWFHAVRNVVRVYILKKSYLDSLPSESVDYYVFKRK